MFFFVLALSLSLFLPLAPLKNNFIACVNQILQRGSDSYARPANARPANARVKIWIFCLARIENFGEGHDWI